MFKQLLLVEPDGRCRARLRAAARAHAHVDVRADFPSARTQLLMTPYDWLITNLRLRAYNGLHLVHLAATSGLATRSVVYAEHHDPSLAREAQRAGAFYETVEGLELALRAYLDGEVPERDRRDIVRRDRRVIFRGGRRSTDSSSLAFPQ